MKKTIIRVIQAILLLVIIYSLYNVGTYYYDRYKAGKEFDEYKDLVSDVVNVEDEELSITDIEDEQEDNESDINVDDNTDKASDEDSKKKVKVKKVKFTKEEKDTLKEIDILKLDDWEEFKRIKPTIDKVAISSLDRLKRKNSDIVAYINIPELNVSYPVVHKDNNYYLRRNLQRSYSNAGTIFIEEKNKPDFTDMNTVIYGHNMSDAYIKSAQMFEPIIKYSQSSFVNSRSPHIIVIFTDRGVLIYQVFSAYYSNATYEYRNLNMDPTEWVQYLKTLESNTIRSFESVEFNKESKIITLSTCDNVNDDGRFAVHAILLND